MKRFRFERDQRRYLVSHANLRRLLAQYAGCAPQELAFGVNEFGKPSLRNVPGEPLHFNLSHSDDVGLLAVTRVGELGADVERIRAIEPEVAEAHFSRRELAELKALSGAVWLGGFFRCWTRKEAILKAEGCGLNLPLGAFDVSLVPGEPAVLRAVRRQIRLSRSWQLVHLEPAPEVVGALATTEGCGNVLCFRKI
jgi:4'-phosphopantetheinyl transferase